MTDASGDPVLSIIVTIVDGGETLRRCLDALKRQEGAPPFEVLIPYDDSVAEVAALGADYPDFTFLDLGALSEEEPANAYEEHEFFDRRRAGGLKAARGGLIAMIEDRGWPRPDWAQRMVEAHRRYPDGVIGGAVESAARGLARWAIFFVDFGRYQAPFDCEKPEYVTDTNICYKREALMQVKHLWAYKYQESEVNWALAAKGVGLRLTSGPRTVQERDPIGLGEMAMERIHWGRTYGQVRARGVPFAGRLKWIAATPLLPIFLYIRHLLRQMRLGRHVDKFLIATPATIYLLFFWSVGELVGYFEASSVNARRQSPDPASP